MNTNNSSGTADLKARARRLVDVLNRGDADAAGELLADDVVVRGIGAGVEMRGREELMENGRAWKRAVPNNETTVDDAVAEGETVVLFTTWRGTVEEEYPGVVPPMAVGKSFEIAIVLGCRFEDGRIAEVWRLADARGMMRQLGLLPDSPGAMVRLAAGAIRHRLTG